MLQAVGLFVGFLAIVVLIDVLVRYLPAVNALSSGRDAALRAQADLRSALSSGSAASFTTVQNDLTEARTDFTTSSTVIDEGWLIAIASHLPWVGDQVNATVAMRHAGAYGTQLGIDLLPLVQSIEAPAAGGTPAAGTMERLFAASSAQQPGIASAQGDLDGLDSAIAAIPTGSLLPQLDHLRTTLRTQGTALSSSAHIALNLLSVAPQALGSSQKHYLVLVENPGEERPGGGYIGAIGEVDMQGGRVLSESFVDSSIFNGRIPPEPAPRPLDAYLFHGVPWEVSDANWDADFPTSAQTVARLYREATGHSVDGVISIDPVALSYVLEVVGTVSVPGYSQTVGPTDTLLTLNWITNHARPGDPGKAYLAPFAHALFQKLLAPSASKLGPLVTALSEGVTQKHIVFWFADSTVQQLVTSSNAGGVLASPDLDGLLVADANLSGGKEDLFVQRAYALHATVASDGTVHDSLTLHYTNPPQSSPANQNLEPSLGGEYDDYVQVFVPASASLDDIRLTQDGATSSVSAEDIRTEANRAVFAYFLSVPLGQSVTLEFDYTTGSGLQGGGYALSWEKQVNALPYPITVDIDAPGRSPLHFTSDMSVDRTFSTP